MSNENMNPQRNNRIVIIIIGIVLLLASLPSEWMTIHNGTMRFDGFPGTSFPDAHRLTATMTGFNGHIRLGAKLPIWLVVLFGIVSLFLTLLNQSKTTTLPTAAVLVPGILSSAFILILIGEGLFSGQVSLGVGGFLAIAGLACGGFTSISTKKNVEQADAGSRRSTGA